MQLLMVCLYTRVGGVGFEKEGEERYDWLGCGNEWYVYTLGGRMWTLKEVMRVGWLGCGCEWYDRVDLFR